jgi:diguanylate cyclase (GGDEF)-like protein
MSRTALTPVASNPSGRPPAAAGEHGGAEREVATRTLTWLYVAGATIGLLTLALPHPAGLEDLGIVGVATGAYAIAALLLLAGPLSSVLLQLAVLTGTGLITLAVGFSGHPGGGYAFFYLWVIVYAAYFLTRRQATAQLLFVALAYAAALIVWGTGATRVTTWVVAIGSLTVAAVVVRMLKERLDELVQRLSRAAETDPLTGLFNRRGFNDRLASELERARRAGRPVGVLVGDLDHFKAVNDQFGHAAGDETLQRVAGLLYETKRVSDTVARIGGEEFALILPYTGRPGTKALAERVRRRVRDSFAEDDVALTMSFGMATFPEDGEDVEALLKSADRAMYTAKDLGRDRSIGADELSEAASAGAQVTSLSVLRGRRGRRPDRS